MPTYEYRCQTCGNPFEVVNTIKNMRRQEHCPVCTELAPLVVSRSFTHGDETPWLNDPKVIGALQDTSSKNVRPITGRQEYKNYLRANDIVERG